VGIILISMMSAEPIRSGAAVTESRCYADQRCMSANCCVWRMSLDVAHG